MIRGLTSHLLRVAATWSAILACASAAPNALVAYQQRQVTSGAAHSAADSALAIHVLNRLTFGPRPGDVGRVLQGGIPQWINQQLLADSALDQGALTALKGCQVWTQPVAAALSWLSGSESFPSMRDGKAGTINMMSTGIQTLVTRDSAQRITANPTSGVSLANGQLVACRLARVEYSEKQLLEVMTDFWENHFSIYSAAGPVRGSIVEYDRAVIRPNALGRFRDLLGAVATSPAMQSYLNNALNSAEPGRATLTRTTSAPAARPVGLPPVSIGLNENYARELLELHTLGVDGGYTQQDIIEVARAFTGWTHALGGPDELAAMRLRMEMQLGGGVVVKFVFDSARHDAESKVVLGHSLAAGRGKEDGDDVLDILARHPSTARFIARKLAVRFVSETPSSALIDSAATAFVRSDGNIREVVREIVTSSEFRSPRSYGAKVKSPLEFVLSLRRALAAPVDTVAEITDLLVRLHQPPFGRVSPDGWPETGQAWMNVGAMRTRLEIASGVARDELPSIPVTAWPEWSALSAQSFDTQLAGVIKSLLSGRASASTRAALSSARPTAAMASDARSREASLRELIALALGSPEFQRR